MYNNIARFLIVKILIARYMASVDREHAIASDGRERRQTEQPSHYGYNIATSTVCFGK